MTNTNANTNATKRLSMTKEAIRKRRLRELKRQEKLRNDSRALAKEIAKQIRADKYANEEPANYTNGDMHYLQNSWGEVRLTNLDIFEEIRVHGDLVVTVQCPTTGCVAGWASHLTGHQFVVDVCRTKESLLEDYDIDDTISVQDCLSIDKKSELPIASVGRQMLGLNERDAVWLFDGDRDIEDVLWALDSIAKTGSFIIADAPIRDIEDVLWALDSNC